MKRRSPSTVRRRPSPRPRRRPPPSSRKGRSHTLAYAALLILLVAAAVWAVRRVARVANAPPPPPASPVYRPQPVPPKVLREAHTYTFYDVLREVGGARLRHPEVINTTRDRHVTLDRDRRPVLRPGRYVLQVASFRRRARAKKVVAELGLLGLGARIDRAQLPNGVVWHRVRIGPITDLPRLNRIRRILAEHHYRPLLMVRSLPP